jgi:hypothetical protein
MSMGGDTFIMRAGAVGNAGSSVGTSSEAAPSTEILSRAVRRLRMLCGVLIGMFGLVILILPLSHYFPVLRPTQMLEEQLSGRFEMGMIVVGGLSLATTTVMLIITRLPWRPQRILNIGLGFQVLAALYISFLDHLLPWEAGVTVRGASPVVLWIMTFPLIPATPRRGALAAFLAAAMGPLSLLVHIMTSWHAPDLQGAFMYYLPSFIAAGLSTLLTSSIYQLSTDVSRAKRLGSYRPVDRLAEGGMGEIWRARHAALVRPAAVKLIRPEIFAGKTVAEANSILRRFAQEAQITASLQSPHTVQLHDFGRTDDGTIYYVMELLNGLSLEALVERFGPQSPERVAQLVAQACHSLHEAHRAGLIHRDIKPANLQVCVWGGELDVLKVLDFGLVKVRARPGDVNIDRDLNGDGKVDHITGTPAYMSPETVARGGVVDERSDLYALGCVTFFLLTGKLVFDAATAMAMFEAHARKKPEPPSRHSELPIPPELDALVMACLDKDPERRPQSAAELRRRLLAIDFKSPWTQERAERWWQTHLPEELERCTPGGEADPLEAEAGPRAFGCMPECGSRGVRVMA